MKFPSVAGLLQVIAILPATFFVLGFFGRFHWALDLFSHFRAQYAAALLLCALGFFLLRKKMSATASLTGALLVITTIILSSQSLPAPGDGSRLKLISFNVNTANPSYAKVLKYLETENADILFLMEVDMDWLKALQPLEAKYPHRLAYPRADNFGIAFLSKIPFRGETKFFGEHELPWADVTLTNTGIRIAAIHSLPPSGAEYSRNRNEQLAEIADTLKGSPHTVLCGDLNLSPYSVWFTDLIGRTGMRSTAPPYSPTWMRKFPLFAIPIDHVLLSPDLTLATRKVGPSLGSDHSALVVEIAPAP
jgi:endonuclease/exonuclease/phosphatase (EEP) superfamily protein YafD